VCDTLHGSVCSAGSLLEPVNGIRFGLKDKYYGHAWTLSLVTLFFLQNVLQNIRHIYQHSK